MNQQLGQQDAVIKPLPASVSLGTALGGDLERILDNHYRSLTTSLTADPPSRPPSALERGRVLTRPLWYLQ